MTSNSLLLLFTTLSLAIATPLSARTWTEAATGRTVEGNYVSADADHVVVKAKGRTFKIAIARLSDADKAFIREQSAKSGGEATDSFTRITPPVSVKSLPVKDREAALEATNNGDQAISRLIVSYALLGPDSYQLALQDFDRNLQLQPRLYKACASRPASRAVATTSR